VWKGKWLGYDVTAFSGIRPHKVMANQFIFGSVGEMILGIGLIYQFRIFERRMGTAKFLSFTFLSTLLSISFQMLILMMYPGFDNESLNRMAPGPYSYVFSLFVQYFMYIPKLQRYNILGAEFSEKTLIYLWGLQLLFVRGRESLLTGICGVLAGFLCLNEKMPFSKFSWPEPLKRFGKGYLEPLLSSDPRRNEMHERFRQQQRMTNMNRAAQMLRAQGHHAQNNAQNARGYQVDQLIPGPGAMFGGPGPDLNMGMPAPNAPPIAPPSEENIEQLTAMGFSRDQVIDALRRNNNDISRAANDLVLQS